METIGIIIILSVIGLIGLSVYMFIDMRRTKADLNKQTQQITETSSQLAAEKQTRESNIKFVVDEVNKVNEFLVFIQYSSWIKHYRIKPTSDKFARFRSTQSITHKSCNILDGFYCKRLGGI